MEESAGCRESDLKKSFRSAVRPLLTACSKQDFVDIFSTFSEPDQKLLYRLYTQVIVNLHQTLEEEFDAVSQEFQVGPILDKVEDLVEEHSLDPLLSDKTNVTEIAKDLTEAKKGQIRKLTGLLQRAEEQNREMEGRITQLRKQSHEVSGTANAIEKDFVDIFSTFSEPDQKLLYRLYTQVIVNLHQTLEEEFDAVSQEFQVGPILDKVEDLVEEQSLDPLLSDKTNVMEIANDLTEAKKSQIWKLTGLLQRAEEQNREMEGRITQLRKQSHEVSGTANAIEKLKEGISCYLEGNDNLPPI